MFQNRTRPPNSTTLGTAAAVPLAALTAVVMALLLLAPCGAQAQETAPVTWGSFNLSAWSGWGGAYNTDGSGITHATGIDNAAFGYSAMQGIGGLGTVTGSYNTAVGSPSLYSITTGADNVAVGSFALANDESGNDNVAVGGNALASTTGGNNIGIGIDGGYKLTTGSNNIDIGNQGIAGESNVIRVGTAGNQTAAFMAGIYGVSAGKGLAVKITSSGQLFAKTSSKRFKTDIHNLGNVSDKLMKLRPVTFRYKQAAPGGTHPVEYGLIAEEVAKVFPELVEYDKAGKPFAVNYDALTPMLLNELQKDHHASDMQNTEIKALKTQLASQRSELTAVKAAQNSDIKALKSQLASLQQSQQQQFKALAQLSQASRNTAQVKTTLYARH